MWLESHFREFKKGAPNSAAFFSSPPDMRERLQKSLANLRLDQFKADNCLPVCTVQKMSDNEEFPNYQGFRLLSL